MPSFSVQTDELRRLAANLATFRTQLGQVTAGLSGLGESESGHARLASALSEFVDGWGYAVGRIDEHARGVEERLGQAAETYTAAEARIVRTAGG